MFYLVAFVVLVIIVAFIIETNSRKEHKIESHSTSSVVETTSDEEVETERLYSLSHFFGIDLLNSPDLEWTFDSKKDSDYAFVIPLEDTVPSIFKECSAMVDTKSKTTFFVFETNYTYQTAFFVLLWIENAILLSNLSTDDFKRKYDWRLDDEEPIVLSINDFEFIYSYNKKKNSFSLMVNTPSYNYEFMDKIMNEKDKTIKKYDDIYHIRYYDKQDNFQTKVIKNHNFTSFVAGVQYRENYKSLLAKLNDGMELQLKKETSNAVDCHAIAVYNNTELLGYIPKKDIPLIELILNNENGIATIDYVDGEKIYLVFTNLEGLIKIDTDNLETFSVYKIVRTKKDGVYSEISEEISITKMLENIKKMKN